MPIQNPGGFGGPPICGQGGRFGEPGRPGLRFHGMRPKRRTLFSGTFTISGRTRDEDGVPLGSCAVHLFETATDIEVAETISDGSGNYTFTVGDNAATYYVVAYKPGAGAFDRAGTTVNTLAAT